jgi:hypothetical protein
LDTFSADEARHLNEPSWFEPPKLFGFVFANLKVLPFRPYSGWMRFFEVEEETNQGGAAPFSRGSKSRSSANRG